MVREWWVVVVAVVPMLVEIALRNFSRLVARTHESAFASAIVERRRPRRLGHAESQHRQSKRVASRARAERRVELLDGPERREHAGNLGRGRYAHHVRLLMDENHVHEHAAKCGTPCSARAHVA
eukprot:983906-Prymnesium_polylepis.1